MKLLMHDVLKSIQIKKKSDYSILFIGNSSKVFYLSFPVLERHIPSNSLMA